MYIAINISHPDSKGVLESTLLYIQIFSDSVCIKIAAKFKSKMLVMTKLANFYRKWTINFIK